MVEAVTFVYDIENPKVLLEDSDLLRKAGITFLGAHSDSLDPDSVQTAYLHYEVGTTMNVDYYPTSNDHRLYLIGALDHVVETENALKKLDGIKLGIKRKMGEAA